MPRARAACGTVSKRGLISAGPFLSTYTTVGSVPWSGSTSSRILNEFVRVLTGFPKYASVASRDGCEGFISFGFLSIGRTAGVLDDECGWGIARRSGVCLVGNGLNLNDVSRHHHESE